MDKIGAGTGRGGRRAGDGGRRPLYQIIADDLRRQIASGALRPGDPLPSESVLMGRYGVARGTVRQARAALRADGTIGGSQGRPLEVRGMPLTQPLGELISVTAWVQGLGKAPAAAVVAFGPEAADETAAAELGAPLGAAVWRLVRVRSADGEPLMIERTLFPDAVGRLLEGCDLANRSVYAELGRRGLSVASARHLVDAIPASPTDAHLLGIAPGDALLRVRRIAFSPAGTPVEWADDRYRGDRTNFAIENDAAAAGLVRRLA